MKITKIIFLFFTYVSYCNCYIFNTKNVKVISDSKIKDRYFGYSLLLQKGKTPTIIVGAPKAKNTTNYRYGGQVYQCQIENNDCTLLTYNEDPLFSNSIPNGDFFGGAIDGEDDFNGGFMACSPRTSIKASVTVDNQTQEYFFAIGACAYRKKHWSKNEPLIQLHARKIAGFYNRNYDEKANKSYNNYAYGSFGFSVCYLNKDNILFGMPGVKEFNGATALISLSSTDFIDPKKKYVVPVIPNRNVPDWSATDSYFGYSVDLDRFSTHINQVWLLAGEPRGNDLKGKATLYSYNKNLPDELFMMETLHIFNGTQFGSYFGASVLIVDVNNDTQMDILIGAPMIIGQTYDEGSVYFYKTLGTTVYASSPEVILTGPRKIGSRFGTTMVSLGDFDLDGFNDVAISAPFEKNGQGAVYIYRGSANGLRDEYSQRLAPSDFNVGTGARGFGMGMSRGNDVDQNGHNDIAIGAYKSDQVFIVKTYSIIDYKFQLTPSINTITNDTTFDLRFCLFYTKRSYKNILLPKVKFNLSIDLDYRSVEDKIGGHISVNLEKTMCKQYAVQIRHTMADISPFEVDLKINTETPNIIAHGEKSLQIQIPYSHGCGTDNICETDLSLELISNSQKIVLGLDKQIDLTVKVSNDGEPAYQCEAILKVPDGIELRNHKDCTNNGENYTCFIDKRLIGLKEKDFIFDIKDIQPDIQTIDIVVQVTSLGKNIGAHKEINRINIPIILENVPYIFGKSIPDNVELEIKNEMQEVEMAFQFAVGKTGPSPLEVDVDILIPVVEHNGENVFRVLEVKGTIDNIQIVCSSSIVQEKSDFNEIDVLKVPLNRTIVVSCNSVDNCVKFSCQGEYLYSSAQVAVFEVRVLTKSSLLVSKYKKELTAKDLVALIPIAFQNSPIDRIGSSPLFLIFAHGVQYVPLWVYLVAPAIGIILLMGISFGLYKCHFFDRVYKDKLDQEKILGSEAIVAAHDVVRRTKPLPLAPTEDEIEFDQDFIDLEYDTYY